MLLHDPQTAGLIEPIRARGAHVVWRCHVGIDTADEHTRAAWEFLLPHVRLADAVVFSRRSYVWHGPRRGPGIGDPPLDRRVLAPRTSR